MEDLLFNMNLKILLNSSKKFCLNSIIFNGVIIDFEALILIIHINLQPLVKLKVIKRLFTFKRLLKYKNNNKNLINSEIRSLPAVLTLNFTIDLFLEYGKARTGWRGFSVTKTSTSKLIKIVAWIHVPVHRCQHFS